MHLNNFYSVKTQKNNASIKLYGVCIFLRMQKHNLSKNLNVVCIKNVGFLSAFVCQRGIRLIYFYMLMTYCSWIKNKWLCYDMKKCLWWESICKQHTWKIYTQIFLSIKKYWCIPDYFQNATCRNINKQNLSVSFKFFSLIGQIFHRSGTIVIH